MRVLNVAIYWLGKQLRYCNLAMLTYLRIPPCKKILDHSTRTTPSGRLNQRVKNALPINCLTILVQSGTSTARKWRQLSTQLYEPMTSSNYASQVAEADTPHIDGSCSFFTYCSRSTDSAACRPQLLYENCQLNQQTCPRPAVNCNGTRQLRAAAAAAAAAASKSSMLYSWHHTQWRT